MKSEYSSKSNADDPCRNKRPDDGLHPYQLKKQQRDRSARAKPGHRSLQYAKAALRVLDGALSRECCWPPLDCLMLHHVQLEGSVLLVTLIAMGRREADLPELRALMAPMQGRLRAELAACMNRKRTPHVRLHVLPDTA